MNKSQNKYNKNKYLVKMNKKRMNNTILINRAIFYSLKIYKLSNQTNSLVIQSNKTVYRLFKNKNYFKMSLQRTILVKIQVKVNKVFLAILGNNKIQFKVDHF